MDALTSCGRSPFPLVAERIEVGGVVQGVGFRPFVYRLAHDLNLKGHVGNDTMQVFIEVEGARASIDAFVDRLRRDSPPMAQVGWVTRHDIPVSGAVEFVIVESAHSAGDRTLIPPDTAVCDDCLAELFDPSNRRYLHPFITCTNCGPRYTIIESLPYDRANTTLADFALCGQCEDEYRDPGDRRYHAQPIGCHDCGPVLSMLTDPGGLSPLLPEDLECTPAGLVGANAGRDADRHVRHAIELIADGAVVAVKGIGGFHYAVDATNEDAVMRLRNRKARPHKPFAVMVPDAEAAQRVARLSPGEMDLLLSAARPVVLAERRIPEPGEGLAPNVAPGNPFVGVLVAYAPLHHLLFRYFDRPLVMTSANVSGEPMIYRDEDMLPLLGTVADAILTHDRPIVAPCDDSVVRAVHGRLLPIRRARGYAPIPVMLPDMPASNEEPPPVLATGGELKNAFCVTSAGKAWVGPHIGDMGSLATLESFTSTLQRFADVFGAAPEVAATDLHPDYHVARWARRHHGERTLTVQHHHAHVASVMAEHQIPVDQEIIGVVFDGTGYGTDGTIWGGEVLRATAVGFRRAAHLRPFPLPGGDAAVEHPARVALTLLREIGCDWDFDLPPVNAVPGPHRRLLEHQLSSGFGCITTTSMGRLFDAVASMLGLCHHISFEAQAAIELEHAARGHTGMGRPYRFVLPPPSGDSPYSEPATEKPEQFDYRPMLVDIVADLRNGVPSATIAHGFHRAVIDLVVTLTQRLGDPGVPVALTGGVFQNALLLGGALESLEQAGVSAYTNQIVPPNDGGLALGQALVATMAASGRDQGATETIPAHHSGAINQQPKQGV